MDHELPALVGPLGHLDQAGVADLVRRGTWANFDAGFVLLESGTPAVEVLVLASGRVRVVLGREESQLLLGIRGPGTTLGELSLLGDGFRSARVIAMDAVSVLRVPGAAFLDFLTSHPQVMLAMLRVVGRRLRDVERRLADIGGQSPQIRLARQLLEHALSDDAVIVGDDRVTVPLDLRGLATWIRATPGETDEALRNLQRAGLVRIWGQGVEILDIDGLRVAALM